MKKLLALIAVLGFASYAQAADGTDFSQSGEFRLQYQHDLDTGFNTSNPSNNSDQFFHQRLKWGLNYRVGEKMSAHVTLVDNANWGENPTEQPGHSTFANNNPTTGQGPNPGQSSFTTNALNVQEAYGTWQASDSVMIKYGRGSVTMGDGRFVSANDYEFIANAFDGILVHWENEMLAVGVFGVKGGVAATNSQGGATAGASDNTIGAFYGVDLTWKTAPDFLKTVSVHYAMVMQDEGDYLGQTNFSSNNGTYTPTVGLTSPEENSSRYGISLGGDKMGIDYRANYEGYSGTRKGTLFGSQSISANMIDAEVGYTMASLMGLRVHVKFHTDSGSSGTGSDGTYQGFYYDRHANNGLMRIFSWGNLTEEEIGVSLNPRDDINVSLNYQIYSKTNSADAAYNNTGKSVVEAGGQTLPGNEVAGTAGTSQNGSSSSALGSELDLAVSKKYTNNFSITGRYGLFTPGSVFKDNLGGTANSQSEYYLESKLTF
jgi:Alginate export